MSAFFSLSASSADLGARGSLRLSFLVSPGPSPNLTMGPAAACRRGSRVRNVRHARDAEGGSREEIRSVRKGAEETLYDARACRGSRVRNVRHARGAEGGSREEIRRVRTRLPDKT
eukprot:1170056-Prorocentrum_minimum.AAC.1